MHTDIHNRQTRTNRGPATGGFTLIELLVVISIIALLVGILLPALGAARRSAQVLKCSSRMKQIMVAMTSYTIDNNGFFPAGEWLGTQNDDLTISYDDLLAGYDGRSQLTRDQMLQPYAYVGDAKAAGSDFYRCPLDNVEAFENQTPNATQFFRRTYSISKGSNPTVTTTAAQNEYRRAPGISNYNAIQGLNPLGNPIRGQWSAKDAEVTRGSSTIALAEFAFDINTMGIAIYSNISGGDQAWSGYAQHEYNVIGHHDGKGLPDTYSERLGNKTNYGFVDGHVEGLTLRDTLTGLDNLTAAPSDYRGTMWDHKQ